tara:strand:- start:1412 stop:2377 length:966 start_codon:yes stop_codon:yes gene_type:complete
MAENKANKNLKRKNIKVISINSCETYDILKNMHYAKRIPHIVKSFGLYVNNQLLGIITYGLPASRTLCTSICGETFAEDVIELNRLFLFNNEKNQASYFVSQTLRLLEKPKIIVSFADANVNHNGYVYQASNFIYTGLSSNIFNYVDKDGKEFHFRNLGHYQRKNKLNVTLIKKRKNEHLINKIHIANYLRKNKGNYSAKKLDKIFSYKDTASHWFRLDKGFSFPKIDDWIKLKKILKFDNQFDKVMTDYEFIADSNEIIKKLDLSKKDIKGKHRYLYFIGTKKQKKLYVQNLKYKPKPYPKRQNKNYVVDHKTQTQALLF